MIRAIVFGCVALGIALVALMFRASSNNGVFEQNYPWLFGLGLALTIGLLGLIAVQVYSLVRRLRTQVFGSKLGLRLMAVFALMAVIPGGLVYAISVQFLNRSIDSWFDVPVDQAFESALNLGRAALDASASDLLRRSRDVALRVADTSADAEEVVRQIRQQSNFDEVLIAGSDGAVKVWIGAAPDGSTSRNRLLPDKPSLAEVQDAITKGPQKFTETLGERAIFSRVVILIPAAPSTQAARVLQIMRSAPREVIIDAQSVESGVRDYQRLQLLRDGLKRVFALTLTLAMVLTLFSAIALSFLLSERLSAPLSALAESTRAIARGDFTKLNPVKSRDEFGVLTQSFNTMTRQLSEASSVVAKKQLELEAANVYLESILGNLTSGVVTLDERLRANSVNRIARDMLGISAAVMESTPLPQWAHKHENLAPMIAEIAELLAVARETPRERPWERQFMIETQDFKNTNPNTTVQLKAVGTPTKRALLVRGTKLPQDIDAGYVLVIDDITGLIQAQRDAAWGEVARRLAHEIKNPLTPIQLSAERMQMKLADKLPEHEREILGRATHTIVAQVAALKRMVDDFSLYSRASRMKPESVDLNELVLDVLALYQSMPAALVSDLAPNLPRITADPALLRQVIHNLMQNAQDALTGVEKPTVTVSTRGDETSVSFCVADNGSGIGADVMARIFEPYITTKPRGTGLGLPIVKKIIEEHRGTILAENTSPQGAMITIHLPIATATGEIG
ncbi:MAG: ATP-binding protein [Betaproteobacteria bacterium]|jgi:nitrogen fixation/metabolism regulation signal transduction histidine kinase